MENKYYIYFHINPLKNEIFYVGKGSGKRAYCKRRRNKHWNNIVSKYGYIIDIVETGLTEQLAFDREIYYIKKIGRDNLTNMTNGGEGGEPWNKGKKGIYTEEQLSTMRVKKRSFTDEEKISRSKDMIGKNTWMKGKKHKEETINKMKGRTAWNKGLKSTTPRDEFGKFISKNK